MRLRKWRAATAINRHRGDYNSHADIDSIDKERGKQVEEPDDPNLRVEEEELIDLKENIYSKLIVQSINECQVHPMCGIGEGS